MRTYLDAFATFRRVNLGSARSTVQTYLARVREFIAWLEGAGLSTDPARVHRLDIDEWLKHLSLGRGNVSSTLAAKLMALRAYFGYLAYKELIGVDPSAQVPIPKRPRRMPQKFQGRELARIFRAPDDTTPRGLRDRALLMTMYGAGLRKHEAAGLQLDDIQDTGAYMYLSVMGKGARERTVTLRRSPARVLRRWLLERQRLEPQDRAVFIAWRRPRKGLRPRHLGNILKSAAVRCGLPSAEAFCHKLRSTWATDLYDGGVEIMEICAQAGWESPDTARRYIKISDRQRRRTAISDRRWRELTMEDSGESIDE